MEIRPVCNELENIAKTKLNEVPSRIQEDLKQIRDWIEKQPHLNCRTDDQWLIGFLRGCKFSLERTKEKLDTFHTLKTLIPEFFKIRDPFSDKIQAALQSGIFLPLPNPKNATGPKIIVYRWGQCDVNTMPFETISTVLSMLTDILLLEDDQFVIAGLCVWVDCNSFPFSYLLQLTPTLVKKAMVVMQKGYPLRIKEIHITNTPPAMESIINLAISMLSQKLKKRVTVYSVNSTKTNFEDKAFSVKLMPKEYGGENGSLEEIRDYWKRKVESYKDWFSEDEKYRSNEQLRMKPKTSADVFGVEGSFRKLELD